MNKRYFFYIFLSFLIVNIVLPCNVPVYRYALERWNADPYRLMIYHKNPLTPVQESSLSDVKKHSFHGDSTLNLIIQLSDLNKVVQNPFAGLEKHFKFPLMVLYYPEETEIAYPAWYGELSAANIALLQNSPARNEVSNRLLSGETAVFLFLESGNSEQDQKYFSILKTELERLTDVLRIPASGIDINGNPIVVPDFQDVSLNFSTIRVSRQDALEELFVTMLIGTEFDLKQYNTPLVFPIFGQGRSLYALVDAGINRNTIEKACKSLINWCSCEIKALHQGVDLLFLADWSKRSGGTWVPEETIPPLTGLSNFVSQKSQSVNRDKYKDLISQNIENDEDSIKMENQPHVAIDSVVGVESMVKKEDESSSIYKHTFVLLLGLIAVVTIGTFILKRKNNSAGR